jgi:hypothetical protein
MNQDTAKDLLNYDEQGQAKLPSGLNVLTILTFIGCSIFGLFTLFSPMLNKFLLGMIDKAASSGQELTTKQAEEMQKGRAALELASQNMIPLMAIGLAGIILCFIGALWMRKFKKDGYWMYVAGELAPVLGSFLIMGTAQFSGAMSMVAGIGIPVIFVILYTMQRKHLTK